MEAQLLQSGQETVLPDLAEALRLGKLDEEVLPTVIYAMSTADLAPASLPLLKPFLNARDGSVRVAAMRALWHIGDVRGEPEMLAGLDDPLKEVRFYAVKGLAKSARNTEFDPDEAEFDKNEGLYVQHWRQWASSESHSR
jgi:HEAT repeat protein